MVSFRVLKVALKADNKKLATVTFYVSSCQWRLLATLYQSRLIRDNEKISRITVKRDNKESNIVLNFTVLCH